MNPRKISLHQRFYAELAAFPALFGRKFFQRLFVSIDCLDHNQSPMRSTLISFFFRKSFQGFIVSASYVCPTSGNLKIFPFLFQSVINLVSVSNTDAMERFQKSSWMIAVSGFLIFVQKNLSFLNRFDSTI